MAMGEGIEKLGLEEYQQGGFWKGELYIDNGKKIHKALDIKSVGILGTVKMLLTNEAVKDAWKKTKDTPGNIKGDGRFVTLSELLSVAWIASIMQLQVILTLHLCLWNQMLQVLDLEDYRVSE